ncbi:hypothetical protein BD626DRAFT_507051 [Schizophyllum amplum]|uniref:Uncharacterized protein n=1 Tax=Schizophyllum amplum TaxID=97359 RepID=A0A550C4H5_9AGAR|nr:hypothetical protein BD626DRAFT_507051 [Auriculariopsis ampla]
MSSPITASLAIDEKTGVTPPLDSRGLAPRPAPSTATQELVHVAREFAIVVLVAYAILSALLPFIAHALTPPPPVFGIPSAPAYTINVTRIGLLYVVTICTAAVFAIYGVAVAVYVAARRYWRKPAPLDLEKGLEEMRAARSQSGRIAL